MSLNALYRMAICLCVITLALAAAQTSSAAERKLSASSGEAKPVNIYGFESGIVHYELKNPTAPGTRTVYFAQQGHLLREETHRVLPNGTKRDELVIMNGNNIYALYPEYHIAVMENGHRGPASIDMEAVAKEAGGREQAMQYFESSGIAFLESEEILGNLCQVWKQEDAKNKGTMWAYKGFPMRIEAMRKAEDGTLTLDEEIIAVEANFEAEVDPSLFKIPQGYEVRTREEIAQQKRAQQEMMRQQQEQAQPSDRPMILQPEPAQ